MSRLRRACRPVIVLGRHGGTEVPGLGASPGTHLLFSSLEALLQHDYAVIRVPPYYYSADSRRSIVIAADLLAEADACLFGLPPHPVDLDAFFLVRAAHSSTRVPFIYLPLGEFPRGAWTYRHVSRRFESRDLLLFSSRADQAIYHALVAASPARACVLPFGIDHRHFRRSDEQRAAVRRHLGIADDVVFVVHSRIMPAKNVHGAIMLFRRVAREQPSARLWIVGALPGESARGPGPRAVSELTASELSETFKRLLSAAGLEDRVLFWGGVSYQALPEILGAADVAVNLTLYEDENFGYSTVEAMACGLPVIGTDWGGLKDTIAHGETGFLVPTVITSRGISWDSWQARRYGVMLAGDAVLRARMGRDAKRRVARFFTLDRFQQNLSAAIRSVLDAPTPADDRARRPLRHEWTAMGERLVRRYSRSAAGRGNLAAPVPLTPTKFADHPLLRSLLAPYATTEKPARADSEAIYFLATELIDVRGARVRSADPRYVLDAAIPDPLDRAVVRLLKRRGYCRLDDLAAEAREDRRALRASLRRLLLAGVALRSR